MMMTRGIYDQLVAALVRATVDFYGNRLVSVAVFGSVGRGTPRPDSDIDMLIVARDLPRGRLARAGEFRLIETSVASEFNSARKSGVNAEISPVFKTPEEVRAGSPLFLDMTEDARILHDENGFLAGELEAFGKRLKRLGAKRIWMGSAWIWDLKPDYKSGEVFEL